MLKHFDSKKEIFPRKRDVEQKKPEIKNNVKART